MISCCYAGNHHRNAACDFNGLRDVLETVLTLIKPGSVIINAA